MRPKILLFALCSLLVAAVAAGQTVSTIKPTALTPPAIQEIQVDKDEVIRRLQENNRRLREENAQLKAQIAAMTSRGGSAVTAYCENPGESRNTAGAADACGVYLCNESSGLCRDRCTSSDHCAGDTRCDIVSGTCQYPPVGG